MLSAQVPSGQAGSLSTRLSYAIACCHHSTSYIPFRLTECILVRREALTAIGALVTPNYGIDAESTFATVGQAFVYQH